MHWTYLNKPMDQIDPAYCGFVYLITCTFTNRKYVGKKIAMFTKTTYKMVTLKNKTKKRKAIKTKVDSDWQTYYGSSKELSSDVAKFGEQHFKREILHFCKSKAEMTYMELHEQVHRNVLHRSDYYNMWISAKVGKFI
jgi:hypothetical protein